MLCMKEKVNNNKNMTHVTLLLLCYLCDDEA